MNFKKIYYNIISLLELQIIMMLFSWPILIYWGLPLSIISPISNIIFSPFLTLFILISFFIFFTELFYIPNNFLINILDFLSSLWIYLLEKSTKSYLILCKKLGVYIFLIPIITLIIIYSKMLKTIKLILLFSLLFLSILIFTNLDNKKILIDSSGILNKPSSIFFLNSYFIKNRYFDLKHLIICRPTITCFKAISNLLNIIDVKNIYIPDVKFNFNNDNLKDWQSFLEKVYKYNVNLYLIDKYKEIKFDNKKIELSLDKKVNKNKLIYKRILVAGAGFEPATFGL